MINMWLEKNQVNQLRVMFQKRLLSFGEPHFGFPTENELRKTTDMYVEWIKNNNYWARNKNFVYTVGIHQNNLSYVETLTFGGTKVV